MKPLVLLFTVIMLSQPIIIYTQSVNGVILDDIKSDYIRIVAHQASFGTKVNISIDFGQYKLPIKARDTQVKDKEGKFMKFNSSIDALNFMADYGYELQHVYTLVVDDCPSVYYLLQRKNNKEKITYPEHRREMGLYSSFTGTP